MKVTVITVCYNSCRTLQRTLQSVVDQDWPNIQHVVIDGGSTDGSLEILEHFRSHLDCMVSEKDSGIYDAMNKGLARANGDIICFLNADDWYASDKVLSDVASKMQAYNLDALMGDVSFFHERNPNKVVRRYRSDRFSPARLAWGWMPAHPALFLHKDVVSRVGGFKTGYRVAGDFEFIIRVFHANNLNYQYLPRVLVCMQTGGASTGGWGSKILLNQEVLRACRENGLQTNMFRILSKYPLKLLEMFSK